MKDYIHEFGADQEKKKLPVTFPSNAESDFALNIRNLPPKEDSSKMDEPNDEDSSISFATEEGYENRPVTYFDPKTKQSRPVNWISKVSNDPLQKTITQKELKEMVSTSVLHMMNAPSPEDFILVAEQKNDIEKRIHEYSARPGVMSISLREDLEKDEASVGILIDPTNTKNWIFIKEEVVYKLPYSYKDALHNFAAEVWKNRIKK